MEPSKRQLERVRKKTHAKNETGIPKGRRGYSIADVVGNRKVESKALIIGKWQGLSCNRPNGPAPGDDVIGSDVVIIRVARVSRVRGHRHRFEVEINIVFGSGGSRNRSNLGYNINHRGIRDDGDRRVRKDPDFNGSRGLVGKVHIGEIVDVGGLATGGWVSGKDFARRVEREVAGDNEGRHVGNREM